MHLRDVCVDLQGNFICDGTLKFLPDDGGKFEQTSSTQLVVDRDGMTIAGCRATRHVSGFFETVSTGPIFAMPQSFAALINDALRFGVKQPVTATIEGQHGALLSSSSALHHFTQPLSDWRLVIFEKSGSIEVAISAELFGAHIRDWLDSEDNFWQSRSRISTSFSVDPVTRQACYYAYIDDLDISVDHASDPDLLGAGEALSLASATIGLSNSFGADGNKWIHVGFGDGHDSYLSFTEHSDVLRLPNGFLSYGRYVWPRAWFHGIQLESLVNLDERVIRYSGPGLRAFASASEGSGGGWHEDATDALVDLSLGQAGLTMSYMMTTPARRLERDVILPWETLLLRLPKLGARWQKIAGSTERPLQPL